MTKPLTGRGFSLSEVLLAMALVAISLALTVPVFSELRRATEVDWMARRVGGLLMRCRAAAILHRRSTGLVFERGANGAWSCFMAEDGDGDGILHSDLQAGRDRYLSQVVDLEMGSAGLGILDHLQVPDPGGRGLLGGDLEDPVRAGRGDIITFTPQGTARPCSVYLTDHHRRMRVLRVIGSTGRIRTMEWEESWVSWRRVGR